MKRLLFTTILAGIAMTISSFNLTNTNLTEQIPVSQSKNNDLLETIQKYAETNNRKPINAKVDRVWKAIPGYNGLHVDIEKSYERMATSQQFDEKLIVFNEVSPTITLKDLPASPIYKGNNEKAMVAFLINVAWGDEFIPSILDTLEKHQVTASFFLDGSWTSKNSELAKLIVEKGHEIGNHAYSHPDLAKTSIEKTRSELEKTNNVILEKLGVTPQWFGPPSGSFNQKTIEIARDLDMYTVLWTVDTVDWKKPETNEMVNRVVNRIENGSMVLMHPTKPTAEGMEEMILHIKEKGLYIGKVSDLLSEQRLESLKIVQYTTPR